MIHTIAIEQYTAKKASRLIMNREIMGSKEEDRGVAHILHFLRTNDTRRRFCIVFHCHEQVLKCKKAKLKQSILQVHPNKKNTSGKHIKDNNRKINIRSAMYDHMKLNQNMWILSGTIATPCPCKSFIANNYLQPPKYPESKWHISIWNWIPHYLWQ